jgi:hypothetical protein
MTKAGRIGAFAYLAKRIAPFFPFAIPNASPRHTGDFSSREKYHLFHHLQVLFQCFLILSFCPIGLNKSKGKKKSFKSQYLQENVVGNFLTSLRIS